MDKRFACTSTSERNKKKKRKNANHEKTYHSSNSSEAGSGRPSGMVVKSEACYEHGQEQVKKGKLAKHISGR